MRVCSADLCVTLCRYGHYSVCGGIVGRLVEHVSSEQFHFWLLTLEELSLGEMSLRSSAALLDRLGTATSHYYKALAAIKVQCRGAASYN